MQYIQLADVEGVPVLIPRATVRAWLNQGLASVTLVIDLEGLTVEDLATTRLHSIE